MLAPAAWRATLSRHPAYHDLGELVLNILRGPVGIHDGYAARFFGGERQKSPAHLSMKALSLTVEPILLSTLGSPPGQAHGNREIEDEGEIRRESVGRDFVSLSQPLKIEASCISLVGQRGIGEAVAEHHCAASQCRLDEMGDMLLSCREDQQGFGLRCHGVL